MLIFLTNSVTTNLNHLFPQGMKIKIIFILLIIIGLFILGYKMIYSGLPDEETIRNYIPETTVENFDNFNWDEEIIEPIRKYVPLSQISIHLRDAVIASEDDLFYQHSGVNIVEMKKAFQENLKKKRFARGASTITMQLARNAFLFKKKTLTRKLKEIILARKIERLWSKRKILEYYLNLVEWGPNVYGAEAAAHYYFDKPALKLDLAESSLLAGILPNPIYYNPFVNFSGAKRKQRRVLRLMRISRKITYAEMQQALNTPLQLRGSRPARPKVDKDSVSIFDSLLNDFEFPDSLKNQADSLGILFL